MAESKRTEPAGLPPELRVLEADIGTWDAEVVLRPKPGAAEERSRGVMINRLTCGGRWLVTDFRNETSGFEGHGVYGWDASRRCYVGTWVDNERTFLAVAEGTWDPSARTMTYAWEVDRGGRKLRWRDVTDKGEEGKLVFRSFLPARNGSELETMTVTYRRRR
jgi:hypothetical protein